ncbi:MAG: methyltransferase domain-containing protein [Chitinophagaceae bacterium]
MPDFSKRSYKKELLDRTDIPFADIKRNMQELEFINSNLGGHQITISGLHSLCKEQPNELLSVCEIGCGGGDNLKAIEKWSKKNNSVLKLIGIDINKDCIEYAKENCSTLNNKEFFTSDYREVNFTANKPDVIFSSLFTHHLNDEQFIEMLKWSKRNSVKGFFINDLHRHFLAFYSIRLLTRIFSKSYLVKNDAPLSVQRGFRKKELEDLLQQAAIKHYTIKWKWAFRWLIIVKHE